MTRGSGTPEERPEAARFPHSLLTMGLRRVREIGRAAARCDGSVVRGGTERAPTDADHVKDQRDHDADAEARSEVCDFQRLGAAASRSGVILNFDGRTCCAP